MVVMALHGWRWMIFHACVKKKLVETGENYSTVVGQNSKICCLILLSRFITDQSRTRIKIDQIYILPSVGPNIRHRTC